MTNTGTCMVRICAIYRYVKYYVTEIMINLCLKIDWSVIWILRMINMNSNEESIIKPCETVNSAYFSKLEKHKLLWSHHSEASCRTLLAQGQKKNQQKKPHGIFSQEKIQYHSLEKIACFMFRFYKADISTVNLQLLKNLTNSILIMF